MIHSDRSLSDGRHHLERSCFGRLRQDNSFEDFRDKNVSLHGCQALCDWIRVYTQPKHGPRVARRFGLNHDLSNQGHFTSTHTTSFSTISQHQWQGCGDRNSRSTPPFDPRGRDATTGPGNKCGSSALLDGECRERTPCRHPSRMSQSRFRSPTSFVHRRRLNRRNLTSQPVCRSLVRISSIQRRRVKFHRRVLRRFRRLSAAPQR